MIAVPYVVMTMMAVLKNYDTRLDLAAQSLGATPWPTLRHVTFPILGAGLLSSFPVRLRHLVRRIDDRAVRFRRPITQRCRSSSGMKSRCRSAR